MKTQIYDWDTDIVYISDQLENFFPVFYRRLIDKFDKMGIDYDILQGTKDIWCRDYMPIQLEVGKFVGYNYDPDYLNPDNMEICNDPYGNVPRLSHLKCPDVHSCQKIVWEGNGFDKKYKLLDSGLILDGGNVVLCDDYVILTNKVYKENGCKGKDKGKEKKELKRKISESFQYRTPLIIPWKKNIYDVYGHSDGMLKFQNRSWDYKPYVLLSALNKTDTKEIFSKIGDSLYLDLLTFSEDFRHQQGIYKYGWAYINYLQVGNKIIVPTFNLDGIDDYVLAQIRKYNPGCLVEGIEMREIAECGSALHCITWNIKK